MVAPSKAHMRARMEYIDDRITYFANTAPSDVTFEEDEKQLVRLRDEQHEGSWYVMLAFLKEKKPESFQHRVNYAADVKLIEDAFIPYESTHGVDIGSLTKID